MDPYTEELIELFVVANKNKITSAVNWLCHELSTDPEEADQCLIQNQIGYERHSMKIFVCRGNNIIKAQNKIKIFDYH